MTRTERFLGWVGEWVKTPLVQFQLLDSAHRQSLEKGIISPEENVGVTNLNNGRAVVKDMRSPGEELVFSSSILQGEWSYVTSVTAAFKGNFLKNTIKLTAKQQKV